MDDLFILTADKDAEHGIRSLLENRRTTLQIRAISFKCVAHPRHDNGVRTRAHEFLRSFLNQYQRALVIFDLEGCGLEEKHSAEQIEANVENLLSVNGWHARSSAIVLEPELEAWLWDQRLNVRKVMSFMQAEETKQQLLTASSLTAQDQIKPTRPKEAFDFLLKTSRVNRSSSLYVDLAKEIDIRHCSDRAFAKFLKTLREWFPA